MHFPKKKKKKKKRQVNNTGYLGFLLRGTEVTLVQETTWQKTEMDISSLVFFYFTPSPLA
jgi:hypothetical protein